MLALLLTLTGCLHTTTTTTEPAEDPVGVERAAITGGVIETGYPAVFALAYDGEGGCTGTCVTPRVGVTAKHCVEGDPASSFTALFGDTEGDPRVVLQVTALQTEASADIAVLAFDADCPATISNLREPLEAHVGEAVIMVGFGVTTERAEDAGIKRSGTATLFSVDPREVNGLEAGELATSNSPAGTCNGDSGGPTFMNVAGVEQLVGITSRGSLDDRGGEWPCGQGRSIAVRADSYAAFIDRFIAIHDPSAVRPPDPPPPPTPSPPATDPTTPSDHDPTPTEPSPPTDDALPPAGSPPDDSGAPAAHTHASSCSASSGATRTSSWTFVALACALLRLRRRRHPPVQVPRSHDVPPAHIVPHEPQLSSS